MNDEELDNNFGSWLESHGVELIGNKPSVLGTWQAMIDLNKLKQAILVWHTRKLNEAVLAELNRLYVEHNRHFGTDTCELIKERITEIKLESIYERRHS